MVSVIIPYFKAEQWIANTIESCLQQGELLHEIIIVDDHSPDNGKAIIEDYVTKYPERVRYYLNPKKGANAARNFGFSQASGKYIQWLDADDEILPGKFSVQIRLLENGPYDVVYSDFDIAFYSEGSMKPSTSRKTHSQYEDFILELLRDNWSSPNNYLLRMEAAKKVHEHHGWNLETKVCQDTEYFNIAALLGFRFGYCPGSYALYRKWSSESTSSRFGQIERQRALLQLYDRFEEYISSGLRAKKKLYLSQVDTNRLYAKIWLNHSHSKVKTPLVALQWAHVRGVKNKFLMVLRYFGVDTANLAQRLLVPR